MKIICFIFFGLCCSTVIAAESGEAYLNKFMIYIQWSQHLPASPTPDFIAFIDNQSPLSQKLREKWLYQLARNKDWTNYNKHYQSSTDLSLQCYAQIARYQQGERQQAIESSKSLWLKGDSQPKACDELFSLLLANNDLDENLITQRLVLALEKRNMTLATYLLKQYKPPRTAESATLMAIQHNPRQIAQLTPSPLHNEFYLYGLKRMVSINMNQAISLWQLAKTKHMMNHVQEQSFLAHVALYKAMRNHEDTPIWFAKVEPAFYNDVLLGWQIRFALKYKQWPQVAYLINHAEDKESPCWQYWLARALEAQGEREKANALYEPLAKTRNYYGFLASLRLNKAFSFENEPAVDNPTTLLPYKPLTDQIKQLFTSNQS